uniref:Uncharacterized protein n=1 Tax=Lepeophtheirus salmonis TaxID=72036 RepID=A0A0K2T3I1_LEPSM
MEDDKSLSLCVPQWIFLSFYGTPSFLYIEVYDDSVEDLEEFMYKDND